MGSLKEYISSSLCVLKLIYIKFDSFCVSCWSSCICHSGFLNKREQVTVGHGVMALCDGTESVSGVLHHAWRCCSDQCGHALSNRAKHSWDAKWTSFVQHSQRYLTSCTALNCESKERYYSYRWHEVRTPACEAQQLLIWQLRAWLRLSIYTCMLVWLYAWIVVWAFAISGNCYMCLFNLRLELCGIAPVRQCAGHHLPSLLAINKHILSSYWSVVFIQGLWCLNHCSVSTMQLCLYCQH